MPKLKKAPKLTLKVWFSYHDPEGRRRCGSCEQIIRTKNWWHCDWCNIKICRYCVRVRDKRGTEVCSTCLEETAE